MQEVISTYDPKDSTSINFKRNHYSKELTKNIKGKKIGIPKEYMISGLNSEIQKNWDCGIKWLIEEGAEVIEISLPHTSYALPTYYIIAPAEASANLARYDGIRFGSREKKK